MGRCTAVDVLDASLDVCHHQIIPVDDRIHGSPHEIVDVVATVPTFDAPHCQQIDAITRRDHPVDELSQPPAPRHRRGRTLPCVEDILRLFDRIAQHGGQGGSDSEEARRATARLPADGLLSQLSLTVRRTD